MPSIISATTTSGLVNTADNSGDLQFQTQNGANTITLPNSSGTILTSASAISASSITTGTLPRAQLPTGSVLQVVSTTKTDSFTTTSTSFTDITGFSVSITPTSATSKVFVTVTFTMSGSSSAALAVFNLVRNSTNISQPSTSPTFTGTTGGYLQNFDNILPVSFTFLDSPATTSATTYKVQTRLNAATMYFNRRESTDCAFTATITAMEIAG